MPKKPKKQLERELTVDNNFKPCPTTDGDEFFPNGIFVFNITEMQKFINNGKDATIVKESVDVKATKTASTSINEDHIDSVDVSIPIILAEISPGRYNVIDGNHRLEKAFRMGMEKIFAYRLNPTQHTRFLITEKGYLAYIEYWNSKLRDLAE